MGTLFRALVIGAASASDNGASAGESVESPNAGLALTQVAASPYSVPGGIYVTHEAETSSRWGELMAQGGAGLSKSIYSFDLSGSAFIGPLTLRGGWNRLHEVGARDVDQLDLVRGQIGANILTGWGKRAELHLLVGALGMHGTQWTPAFDVEADARVFPVRPLQIRVSAGASFFERGAPLIRAQFAPGITLGRVDVGLSGTWLYQERTLDVASPGVWLAFRL